MKRPLPLSEYARKEGIEYFSAWRRYKKGRIACRRLKDGRLLVTGEREGKSSRWHPVKWTRERVSAEVNRLCRGRYVNSSDFPPYLYKLCRKHFGSVRAAKWEARILYGRNWTREEFFRCVRQLCAKRYREDRAWPSNLRALARHFCGSVRRAKLEAGVLNDPRRKLRSVRSALKRTWTRRRFLDWVHAFCRERYRKQEMWPSYMRQLAKVYCGSVRKAKLEAGILRNMRRRRPSSRRS